MFIPDSKMDVNKFQAVHIPSKSSYLEKFGFTKAPSSMFTGDEFAPTAKDKIQAISEMESYDRMMQEKELESEKPE